MPVPAVVPGPAESYIESYGSSHKDSEARGASYGGGEEPPLGFGELDWKQQYEPLNEFEYFEPVAHFTSITVLSSFICRNYNKPFESDNWLHRHLWKECLSRRSTRTYSQGIRVLANAGDIETDTVESTSKDIEIVESMMNAKLDIGTGYGFRN